MICEQCIRAAVVSRAMHEFGADSATREEEAIKHPHCENTGCTCQHKRVDAINSVAHHG